VSAALTICTVSFRSEPFVVRNVDLTASLNPDADVRWVIVENGPGRLTDRLGRDRVQIVGGPAPDLDRDERSRASYHHAAGLQLALEHVETRFALILDPDLYVVRPGWIEDVLSHMQTRELAFFGVPWHPRWFTKYRYFPCVHCLFVDLGRVPRELLDFTPEITPKTRGKVAIDHTRQARQMDRVRRRIRRRLKRWKVVRELGRRRSIGGSYDTGYRIYLAALKRRNLRHEAALPVYDPRLDSIQGAGRLSPRDRLIDVALPDRRRFTPRRRRSYATTGFVTVGLPDLRALGWEEFVWRERPFAFHLRWHRRDAAARAEAKRALPAILDRFTSKTRAKARY